jgi:integrase/recombinase XerD
MRYGVRYLLRRYVQKASQVATFLRSKKLHPHAIRHSTAVALLKSGVDFATISQWLGHAGLNTTMRYARAHIDLKRRAGDSCWMARTSSAGCGGRRHI